MRMTCYRGVRQHSGAPCCSLQFAQLSCCFRAKSSVKAVAGSPSLAPSAPPGEGEQGEGDDSSRVVKGQPSSLLDRATISPHRVTIDITLHPAAEKAGVIFPRSIPR